MFVIGSFTWCVGGCECFSQSQYTHCPEQTIAIAINLSINSCGNSYKIYCSNIECPIMRVVYRSPESNRKPTKWKIHKYTPNGAVVHGDMGWQLATLRLSQEHVSAEIWKKYLASWLGGRIPWTCRVSGILPPTNKPDISFWSLHEHCSWLYLIPSIVFRLIKWVTFLNFNGK